MRAFKLEQSNKEITSHAGLALIGRAINNFTSLTKTVDKTFKQRSGTSTSDLLKIYIGLLAQGKNDFEAVNNIRDDSFFMQALGLKKRPPTEATLRTRFEKYATQLIPIIDKINTEFLVRRKVPLTPLHTGHFALDIDVTPHDNSNSKKEHVSLTYKGMDGYAPIGSYFAEEGWIIGYELRPGKQHSQREFVYTLERNFDVIHKIMKSRPISSQSVLVRVDSGHDAAENRAWLYNLETPLLVDHIIKWNPRKDASMENKENWLEYVKQLGHHAHWSDPREGKQVATFSIYVDENYQGKTYTTRRVMQVTIRTIDKKGQKLLLPEIELEGWWTTLENPDQEIISLYCDHGTSEQFHSEIKTDMDLERLPSGKFDSNDLILTMGGMVYNMLRWIGLDGLMSADSPVRHKAKRRRVKTVIQELIYIGAQIYERSRQLTIRFGQNTPAFLAFQRVYNHLAYS
ncbi:MAG: IS1380 family transposase [bacterium]|nr:IS1380 family transposase [bacterium]